MDIKKHLDLLGYEVQDRVSDFSGVVVSISFDLYGCVQADVRPKELSKEDGTPRVGYWLDVCRLRKITSTPLMEQPTFEWNKGPAKSRCSSGMNASTALPRKERI